MAYVVLAYGFGFGGWMSVTFCTGSFVISLIFEVYLRSMSAAS